VINLSARRAVTAREHFDAVVTQCALQKLFSDFAWQSGAAA
jgi:hypothetical protein